MKARTEYNSRKTGLRWLRNPLLHFFILGAAIFGLHVALTTGAKPKENDPWLVEVTSADIKWLRSAWSRRMQREPNPQELQNMIDAFIREEILSREAAAMGLDERDSIIRRRLAQKMEFLFKDLAEMNTPTDEELKAYLADHRQQYVLPPQVSFTHVYFNVDRRGGKVGMEVKKVLQELKADNSETAEVTSLGDPFLLQSYYSKQSPDETAREFGDTFAKQLFSLEAGQWYGPLESAYGIHLVYIHERINSRMPELEEIRKKVEADLLNARQQEVNQKTYNLHRYSLPLPGLGRGSSLPSNRRHRGSNPMNKPGRAWSHYQGCRLMFTAS